MGRQILTASLLVLVLLNVCIAQQSFRIAKIEFEGLQKVSPEDMLATTNLKVGDSFQLEALDAAAQKLVESGFFKNVSYRTKATKDQITIIFQVEETQVTSSRVIFDNFIWFSDAELITAVHRDIPSFNGSAPDTGDMVERITKALQRFLHENKIDATVSHLVSQDAPGSTTQDHVFTVNGVPMPICTLLFPGAQNISEAQLRESSKSLVGSEYSNKFVSLFAVNNLYPMYSEKGQLKAAFSPPTAKPEATATCKSGVETTIPVAEGDVYKWNDVEWAGNTAFSKQELDSMLGMKTGEVANGLKIDKAIKSVQRAFGTKGFLLARLRTNPQFDDAKQIVTYSIVVTEGPQFLMGNLVIKGFSEQLTKEITQRWDLKSGQVFDNTYSEEFSRKQLGEIMQNLFLDRRNQGKPAPNVKWTTNLNRQNLTVDVLVELTN